MHNNVLYNVDGGEFKYYLEICYRATGPDPYTNACQLNALAAVCLVVSFRETIFAMTTVCASNLQTAIKNTVIINYSQAPCKVEPSRAEPPTSY